MNRKAPDVQQNWKRQTGGAGLYGLTYSRSKKMTGSCLIWLTYAVMSDDASSRVTVVITVGKNSIW